MGRLSENFTRKENRCHCGDCDRYGADAEVVEVLEEFRAHLRAHIRAGSIINPTSWYRCRAHNNRPKTEFSKAGVRGVGSNDRSWHLTGGAVDIKVPGISPGVLAFEFRKMYPDKYGLGIYDWGIHIDVRPGLANWDERS